MSACAACEVTQAAEEDALCWNCSGPTNLIPGDWPGPWSAGASYYDASYYDEP